MQSVLWIMNYRNKDMKKILTIAACSLMMASCGLYNKYERPDVNTQGLVRDIQNDGDTLALNSDENFGNLPWREVFTDPQLQGLIEQALENNVDLRNAALNVKMMETALTVSKLAFLPSVAFAPQGTISQVQMDGASVSRTYQLPISATWNLDLFGNLLSQKRSAQMKLLATKDYQVAVQTKIICGVANLYYTLMMLDEQLAIVTDMEGLGYLGYDEVADGVGSRPFYQCADGRGQLLQRAGQEGRPETADSRDGKLDVATA